MMIMMTVVCSLHAYIHITSSVRTPKGSHERMKKQRYTHTYIDTLYNTNFRSAYTREGMMTESQSTGALSMRQKKK
jgi:hypothetical protein